jgi:hypothetical protein
MDANNIKKCDHCPVKCGQCIAEKTKHSGYCKRVDPNAPDFNNKYIQLVEHLSCGTPYEGNITIKTNQAEKVKHVYPSVVQQSKNFVNSMWNFAKDGFKLADDAKYNKRLSVCNNCPLNDKVNGRCTACGCFIDKKARIDIEKCPKGLWDLPDVESGIDITQEPIIIHPANDCGCDKNKNADH